MFKKWLNARIHIGWSSRCIGVWIPNLVKMRVVNARKKVQRNSQGSDKRV